MEIQYKISNKFNNNKKKLFTCCASIFIWGLVAHAFIFFNASFTHDSINEFDSATLGNELRIQYGRVFVPLYRMIFKTNFALPWLTGFLALLWIALSLFLIVKAFNIKSNPIIFLLGGIMSVNLTVTAVAATYIHDLDCDMFALLLSVAAFYIWDRYKHGLLWGSILIGVSLGLYQSYISAAITLIIIFSIFSLLNGAKAKDVIIKGLKGILMLIVGGIIYYFFSRFIPFITKTQIVTDGYNSVYKKHSFVSILLGVVKSYLFSISRMIFTPSGYNALFIEIVNIAIIIITLKLLGALINNNIKDKSAKALAIILIVSIPLGMNVSQIFTGGIGHDVMRYCVCFSYLLALLTLSMYIKTVKVQRPNFKSIIQIVSLALIFIVLWGNVQFSNTVYIKKDIECESNKILFTRVLDKMESADGYVSGETPVAFVGKPKKVQQEMPNFTATYKLIGCESSFALGAAKHSYYQAYFDYVLTTPILLTSEQQRKELYKRAEVKKMPAFPSNACVQMIDGILVVKLG